MTRAAIVLFGLFGITGIGCMALLVSVWIEAVKISDKPE